MVVRYCKEHRALDTVKLVLRRCKMCDKRPSYGNRGQEARFCAEHKEQHHVNVKVRMCEEKGCDLQPSFGSSSDGVKRFCKEHRLDGHTDLRHGQRCREEDCWKQACYGFQGGVARFCASHKPRYSINVGRGSRSRSQSLSRSSSVTQESDNLLAPYEVSPDKPLKDVLMQAYARYKMKSAIRTTYSRGLGGRHAEECIKVLAHDGKLLHAQRSSYGLKRSRLVGRPLISVQSVGSLCSDMSTSAASKHAGPVMSVPI